MKRSQQANPRTKETTGRPFCYERSKLGSIGTLGGNRTTRDIPRCRVCPRQLRSLLSLETRDA